MVVPEATLIAVVPGTIGMRARIGGMTRRERLHGDEAAALIVEPGGVDRAHDSLAAQIDGVGEHAVSGIEAARRFQRDLVAPVGHGVGQGHADVATHHDGAIDADVGLSIERELSSTGAVALAPGDTQLGDELEAVTVLVPSFHVNALPSKRTLKARACSPGSNRVG